MKNQKLRLKRFLLPGAVALIGWCASVVPPDEPFTRAVNAVNLAAAVQTLAGGDDQKDNEKSDRTNVSRS